MKNFIRLLLLVSCLLVTGIGAAQVVVIVGTKSPTSSLTKDQVAALFLGKLTQLPTNSNPVLTDQPETSPVREQFYTKVTEKSVALAKAGWTRLVFSGKANRPKESANSAEVKKFVSGNPDAFGYIEKSEVDASVKVVFSTD